MGFYKRSDRPCLADEGITWMTFREASAVRGEWMVSHGSLTLTREVLLGLEVSAVRGETRVRGVIGVALLRPLPRCSAAPLCVTARVRERSEGWVDWGF